eukprot:51667_1
MTAADWDEIGDRHYRKREIYTDLRWTDEEGKELKLNDHVVVGCPFGGPIAMVLDERKRSQMQAMQEMCFMRIFTCSAKLISSFRWEHRGLIKLGWSEEEHLVVVLEDATVIIYDMHGKLLRHFSMGQECSDAHIADAYIWSTGLVVRTAGDYFQFWAQMKFMDSEEEPFSLCNPNIERPPVFMTAIHPDINNAEDDDIEVLISTGDGGIWCVSRSNCTKLLQHRGGAIMRMCISANGRIIAIIDENMNLIVSSRNFQKQMSNFSVKSSKQPLAMEWCGSDAVILVFNNDQIICAASNEFIPYPYSDVDGIILCPEVDSMRIITSRSCEVLSIVPFCTQDIFSYGSREPASLLYDSFEDFNASDARADAQRRKIAGDAMEEAVMDCLNAAKYELEVAEYQVSLLRACKYGKLFIQNQELFDCDAFVETCRFLRVLNSVRNVNIGMALSYRQLEILSAEVVVQRLINRKHHLLAIKVASYLNLPLCVSAALEHWAICKIESTPSSVDDRELVAMIRRKIVQFCSNFNYAKIARCAQKRSVALAKMLLDYEPRSAVQINCLIEFEEYIGALRQSLRSLDCDLIHQTLVELIDKYSDRKVWHRLFELIYAQNITLNDGIDDVLIASFIAVARSMNEDGKLTPLLEKFLLCNIGNETQNAHNLHFLAQDDLRQSMQLLAEEGALDTVDNEDEIDTQKCLQHLEKATRHFERLKHKFNVQMCSDFKRMIVFQKEFDAVNPDKDRTLGKSVNETIAIMLRSGQEEYADRIRRQVFVSDKQWWFLVMNAYLKKKELLKLHDFIDRNTTPRRPPPCGYLPIIEALLQIDENEAAKKYILKLADIDEKLEWLCQLKFWMDAVEVAVDEKDFDALQTIKHNCNDDKVIQRINQLFDNLK